MTIQDLRDNNLILLECISGSRAYGLDLPTSDTDLKGVFILPKEKYYGLDYIPQVANETNDEVFYELKRFFELLAKNNPNILELLNTPDDKIIFKHPLFDQLDASLFLSKKCKHSFAGYAMTQIKKARGLNKKIVNPIAKEKKNILHFCYVIHGQGSIPFLDWLGKNNFQQENCGLVNIAHMKNLYALFYDKNGDLNFNGVMKKETANDVLLSSVPKGTEPISHLSFNLDGYAKYCKDYKEYWSWVELRNEARYENTVEHGKNYDTKNMMHTFRLLHMAEEILRDGKVNVHRENREELLAIRFGKFSYDELIEKSNQLIQNVEAAYLISQLPEVPNIELIEKMLLEIRDQWYQNYSFLS
jgi:hypothetical protein